MNNLSQLTSDLSAGRKILFGLRSQCINPMPRMNSKSIEIAEIKGDFLRNSGLADEAIQAYQNIVKLYRGKPEDKLLAEVYRNLGRIQKSRQEFDSGIEFLNKAMEIYRRENDELEISITTKDMGSLYCVASNLPQSIKYYRRALRIQRKLNAISDASTTLHNIGSIYGMMGRLSRTVWLLNITLKMKIKLVYLASYDICQLQFLLESIDCKIDILVLTSKVFGTSIFFL